jgi:hypothetical protein
MTTNIEKYTIGTADQKEAYCKLKDRWTKVGDPQLSFGNVWMVEVAGETGMAMWLGIEEDGYTHS